MNKSLIILLFFLLAVMDASAAVKKKRFDVGGGDAPAATEMVAPAEGASAVSEAAAETAVAKSVAAVPEKKAEKTRFLYGDCGGTEGSSRKVDGCDFGDEKWRLGCHLEVPRDLPCVRYVARAWPRAW